MKLTDKFTLEQGRVYLTGIQALVRLPIDQMRRDRRAGLNTGAFISGYPAVANREWLKSSVIVRQLPALKKRIAQLEARIAELEETLIECRTRQDP